MHKNDLSRQKSDQQLFPHANSCAFSLHSAYKPYLRASYIKKNGIRFRVPFLHIHSRIFPKKPVISASHASPRTPPMQGIPAPSAGSSGSAYKLPAQPIRTSYAPK